AYNQTRFPADGGAAQSNPPHPPQIPPRNSPNGPPYIPRRRPKTRGLPSRAKVVSEHRHLPNEIPTAAQKFRRPESVPSPTITRRDVDFRSMLQMRRCPRGIESRTDANATHSTSAAAIVAAGQCSRARRPRRKRRAVLAVNCYRARSFCDRAEASPSGRLDRQSAERHSRLPPRARDREVSTPRRRRKARRRKTRARGTDRA